MLDQRDKTMRLLAELKAAAPFEVELTQRVIDYVRAQDAAVVDEAHPVVKDLSYAGDEGGIMCHLRPAGDGANALVVSLTHVRVPRRLPFAAAAAAYQKHRVKKLRKQNRS